MQEGSIWHEVGSLVVVLDSHQVSQSEVGSIRRRARHFELGIAALGTQDEGQGIGSILLNQGIHVRDGILEVTDVIVVECTLNEPVCCLLFVVRCPLIIVYGVELFRERKDRGLM